MLSRALPIRPLLAALAILAAPVAAADGPALLSVSAEGRVARAPDVADLSTGVVTQAVSAAAALRDNATRMTAVVTALKRAGIADRDLQTSGINLQPQYRYADNQPPVLTGYQVSNTLNVRIRDLPGMGRVIDSLVSQGANQINGPSFRLDKPDAALDEARREAMAKARTRATLYAEAAGLKVRRIVSISEGGAAAPQPYPMPMLRAQMAMADKAETHVAAGEVDSSVTVSVTFELD